MNYSTRLNMVFCLTFLLTVTACGGGGDGNDNPATSSLVSSSTTTSSSSVTSSSQSSSSSSMSSSSLISSSSISSSSRSSSSTSSLPGHTSTGVIYCTAAGDDADGDGWGWENNASCIVRNSNPDPDKGNFQGCIIGTTSWSYCTTDNGSWGYENETICVSNSFCPANRTDTQTALSENLIDPSATATTEKVYDYLRSIWGSKTLSGQMDLTWKDSIDQYQRVINDTTKAPAIMGYDFMNYGMTADWVEGLEQTEEAIVHWNRGGLVTFTWHWRAGSENAFYSNQTNFSIPIANGQLNTASPDFTKLQNDLDMIAVELKKLQTAGVPVLWRPLHEASGGWFWWGRARTDVPPAYAQTLMWRYIHDRLTNHHGLHNLIWVWNGQSAAWYPGNNYVDIVSTDIYDSTDNKTYKSQITSYNIVKKYPLQSKLVVLSENSYIPDPDKISTDGAWWLWFMVWNDSDTAPGVTHENNFWTGEYYNTNAHKTKVYNHANVITLDELPDFDSE
jgi:mannan endo-1,4-beta-mannosidase